MTADRSPFYIITALNIQQSPAIRQRGDNIFSTNASVEAVTGEMMQKAGSVGDRGNDERGGQRDTSRWRGKGRSEKSNRMMTRSVVEEIKMKFLE